MSAQAQPSRETLIDVRTLQIVSGDGQRIELRTVRCPADRRSVSLERCLECPESGGLARSASARAEYVACRSPLAAERLAAEASPAAGAGDGAPVSAVMTADVLAVRPDVSVETLTELLLERHIGGAPVVDADGHPVGVVSTTDLLGERFEAGDTGEGVAAGWAGAAGRGRARLELGPGVHVEAFPDRSVGDVMTRAAFTLPEDMPIAQAAALMAVRDVHRMLVVSDAGRVVGVVTSTDLARWVAQQGGYLRRGA